MQTTLDLGAQTAEVARIVAGVRDDQLGDPTPCAGTTVAGLLDHLVGLTLAFRLGAEKAPSGGGPTADPDDLAPDWRTRLPAQLAALAAAWREPAAQEGTAEVGGVPMPAPVMATVALNEVLIHGWDLAVATGQQYRADPAGVAACADLVGDRTDTFGEPPGLFGPVVTVSVYAAPFDRLLGQTGRDPGWTPDAAVPPPPEPAAAPAAPRPPRPRPPGDPAAG